MILYIGNKLSKHGNTASSVETLGPLLGEYYDVLCVSDKLKKTHRLLDIVRTMIENKKKIKVILIDTYSTQGFYFAFISARLALLFNIPYVLLLRGGNLEVRLRDSPRLSRMLFKPSYRLVAPSHFLYDTFKTYGYKNLTYIPNNIKIENYTFKARVTIRPRLLWVRSFSHIYNPAMAVEVAKQLTLLYSDVVVCMVGPDKDGSLQLTRDYAESLGVKENVEFKGKLEKPDWHLLSEDYDIFINTANVDNTPVSVMEAMALGLPIVSTKAGGIPYLINDKVNGLLVDVDDASAMVAEIKRLIENPMQASMLAESARCKILEFDWQNVKKKWLSLINEIL